MRTSEFWHIYMYIISGRVRTPIEDQYLVGVNDIDANGLASV